MNNGKNLKALFGYAGKFKYFTVASWVLSALSALLALVPFAYIWLIIKEVLEVMPDFSAAVSLAHNGWMAVLLALLSIVVYFAALMCSHVAAFRIASNIRTRAMAHIVKLPLGIMGELGSGRVRRIVNESSAATETYLAHQLPDMAGAVATPLGMIAILMIFDWRLGLVSLAPALIAFIIMAVMTGKGMAERMKQYQNALEDMNNQAVEYIRGVPVVKTFGQTVFSFKRFKGAIDRYRVFVVDYTKNLRGPMLWYTLIINSVFALLIAAGLLLTGHGAAEPVFLLNFIFYIVFTPIISVTLTKVMYMSENGLIVNDALARIDSLFEIQPLPQPEKPLLPEDNSVEFENVSFRYRGGAGEAVKNLSFRAEPNETIAFVGPSGGGKTTVAGLISRFWDVTGGSVKIGGTDVRSIDKKTLSETVAYVFQDSRLLKASIFENVLMGRPAATKEEALAALHSAQCGDIIAKLPQGADTVVGKKGVFLSGGEQQRIAIARLILKDAPIIVLDEATAFADPENEYLVQKAFERLSYGKTVIIIAHRLTTIKNADRIFVLNNGEIVESGRHEQLAAEGKQYKKMWNDYMSSVAWKIAKEANRD